MSPRLSAAALSLVALCTVPACAELGAGPTGVGGPAAVAPGEGAKLLAALGQPRPEDTGAHYRRQDWGEWDYDPATKCNTREKVLARDGRGVTTDDQCRPQCPTGDCWTSHYDGVVTGDPADLQIDHIVPLAEANRSGARHWDADRKAAFYNDPANLLAVTGASNSSKGDSDPGRWRPAQQQHWCQYATAYASVKAKYGLAVDDREHAELTRMLNACPKA